MRVACRKQPVGALERLEGEIATASSSLELDNVVYADVPWELNLLP